MKEQLTTYRVKGKTIGLEFLFKYSLNGKLKFFEVSDGELDDKQTNWLFRGYLPADIETLPFTTKKELNNYLLIRFPANEAMFKSMWLKNKEMNAKFEIQAAPADLSFDALWKLYDLKIARFHAVKAFGKLKEETIIKLFVSIPIYKKYLAKSGIAQAHLATYINGQYYDNEYKL